MKKRTLAAVVVAAALVVGSFFSGRFPGFGTGQQATTGGPPAGQPEPVSTEPSEEEPAAPNPEADATPDSPTPTPVVPQEVLDVRIVGRTYQVLFTGGVDGETVEYQPAELSQVVELAQSASGDDNGIRVRIELDDTARMAEWLALKDALKDAGLSENSLREMSAE